MDRLPWRENRTYNVFVAGAYKKAFQQAAAPREGIADHPDYQAAKYEASIPAAMRVVESAMNRLYVTKMRLFLNDLEARGIKNPILVAPYKENSPNRLARTAALHLGKQLGLEVDDSIVEKPGVSLKTLSKLERMFNSPDFEGDVQKGRWYIAVDDTISSGTTMAALRSHVVGGGARFLCGCALASPSAQNAVLNASKDEIKEVVSKLGDTVINWFERMSHVAMGGLTKAEANFLAKPQGRRELIGFAAQTGLFKG